MSRTRYLWFGLALAFFAGGPIRAGDDPPKDKQETKAKETPDERYQALLKEYNDAQASYQKISRDAKTDAERQKAFEKYPRPATYYDKFLKLAEEEPKSKVAFDALMWIGTKAIQDRGEAPNKALVILSRDYIDNERLADVAGVLRYSMNAESEQFLRDVLERSPNRKAKGIACLTLARVLSRNAKIAYSYGGENNDERRMEILRKNLGKGYADAILGKGGTALQKESEGLFERAKKEFADIPFRKRTVGYEADSGLFELKNLEIGKPAPEIVGEDIDGKPLKLSDFKGKVVVLDFFGDW